MKLLYRLLTAAALLSLTWSCMRESADAHPNHRPGYEEPGEGDHVTGPTWNTGEEADPWAEPATPTPPVPTPPDDPNPPTPPTPPTPPSSGDDTGTTPGWEVGNEENPW